MRCQKKDRKQVYEWMSRIAAGRSGFYEVQADYYRRLEDVIVGCVLKAST